MSGTVEQDPEEGVWLPVSPPKTDLTAQGVPWGIAILLAGLIAFAVVIDLGTWGRSPLWFEVLMPAAALAALLVVSWILRRGPLSRSPTAIRLSRDAIGFRYANSPPRLLQLTSPRFELEIEDVFGSWDPEDWRGIGPKSHRFVLTPPRGRGVYVEEPMVQHILAWADRCGLTTTRGPEYRKYDATCRKILIRTDRSIKSPR